jgi:hypothetical protein
MDDLIRLPLLAFHCICLVLNHTDSADFSSKMCFKHVLLKGAPSVYLPLAADLFEDSDVICLFTSSLHRHP